MIGTETRDPDRLISLAFTCRLWAAFVGGQVMVMRVTKGVCVPRLRVKPRDRKVIMSEEPRLSGKVDTWWQKSHTVLLIDSDTMQRHTASIYDAYLGFCSFKKLIKLLYQWNYHVKMSLSNEWCNHLQYAINYASCCMLTISMIEQQLTEPPIHVEIYLFEYLSAAEIHVYLFIYL